MPRAYGADRVESGPDGGFVLISRVSKGWTARRPKTFTSVEHPGTAVAWDGSIYEVITVEADVGGAVRYRLAPWDERNILRASQAYDARSEEARERARRETRKRARKRRLSILIAPLAGHLPARVQERMEQDFDAPATVLTIVSAAPLFAFGALCNLFLAVTMFGDGSAVPLSIPVLLAGEYLFAESALRLGSALAGSRPAGSLLGTIAYEAWQAIGRGNRDQRSRIVPKPATPAPDAPRDAYLMRKPLLCFLAPAEQEFLAERFGFDPIRWGKLTAKALLAFAGLNVVVSLAALAAGAAGLGDLLWLFGAGYFVAEQIARLRKLGRLEPAGSVLGILVRPLARKLLSPTAIGSPRPDAGN